MLFRDLEEQLRSHIWSRIHRGETTGVSLAAAAGFRQAHLSNFLNRRRGLSLEAMDRLLGALQENVVDLVGTQAIGNRAGLPVARESSFESVAMIAPDRGLDQPRYGRHELVETLNFRKTFLRRLPPALLGDRRDWVRFVATRAEGENARGMAPRIAAGATLLIDRHYNALQPYRRSEANIYAVRTELRRSKFARPVCAIRYVTVLGETLILRPHEQQHPLQLISIEEGRSYADYLIGRVCHVAFEV